MDALAAASLAHGVSPSGVRAALTRWPGRARVVATLLGVGVGQLEAELERLRAAGLDADAALDALVLG